MLESVTLSLQKIGEVNLTDNALHEVDKQFLKE